MLGVQLFKYFEFIIQSLLKKHWKTFTTCFSRNSQKTVKHILKFPCVTKLIKTGFQTSVIEKKNLVDDQYIECQMNIHPTLLTNLLSVSDPFSFKHSKLNHWPHRSHSQTEMGIRCVFQTANRCSACCSLVKINFLTLKQLFRSLTEQNEEKRKPHKNTQKHAI